MLLRLMLDTDEAGKAMVESFSNIKYKNDNPFRGVMQATTSCASRPRLHLS